ncbi:hypothetical protein BT69DRAFT_1282622 [Atractiella rhizophila]|nr:hypothetical protein BT69DRAFT_1282622 [Atractiella rhizophila]
MEVGASGSQSSLSDPSDLEATLPVAGNVTENDQDQRGLVDVSAVKSGGDQSKTPGARRDFQPTEAELEKEEAFYKNLLPPSTVIRLTTVQSRLEACQRFETLNPISDGEKKVPTSQPTNETEILGRNSRRSGKESELSRDHFVQLHKAPEQREKQAKKFELERLRQERNKLKSDYDKLINPHVAERTIKSIIGRNEPKEGESKESKEELDKRKATALLEIRETLKRYEDILTRSKKSSSASTMADSQPRTATPPIDVSTTQGSGRRKRESAVAARQSMTTSYSGRKKKISKSTPVSGDDDELDELSNPQDEDERPKKKVKSSPSIDESYRRYSEIDASVVLERPYYQTQAPPPIPPQQQRQVGIPVHVPAGPYPPGMIPAHYYAPTRASSSANQSAYAWGTKLPDFHDIRREFELDPWTPEFRQVYYLYGQENVTLRKLLNDRKKYLMKQAERNGSLLPVSAKIREVAELIAPSDQKVGNGFTMYPLPTFHPFVPPTGPIHPSSRNWFPIPEDARITKPFPQRNGSAARAATSTQASGNGRIPMHTMYSFGPSKDSLDMTREIDLQELDQMEFV